MRSGISNTRIAIVGSRGIPASYGGFETFAEELAGKLVRDHGYHVTVVCDAEQRKLNNAISEHSGIELRYSRFSKSRHAIWFYLDSINRCVRDHDIILSCGPAGGLFGPLVRLHRKSLLTNPDGLNGMRSKWSRPIQVAFRMLERVACLFSHGVVCDSQAIEDYIRSNYACEKTHVAEYGAHLNPYIGDSSDTSDTVLEKFGLQSGCYHLIVARLEPENNIHTIMDGYSASTRAWPLIVVGNLSDSAYVARLKQAAGDKVKFVGGIYDKQELAILRAHAATYLHGHSVGGTNPSLLEAMGSRNLCICHGNVFNRETVGEAGLFFDSGATLDTTLANVEDRTQDFDDLRDASADRIKNYYSWENIAAKYHRIFQKVSESDRP